MSGDDFTLKYEKDVVIPDFPIRWVPLLGFFDPELPGLPLVRIHFFVDDQRIFCVPISHSVEDTDGENCRLRIRIMINSDFSDDGRIADEVKDKLTERLGLSEAMDIERLKDCCQLPDGTKSDKHAKWEKIVEMIFPRLEKYYGSRIPCGQFYPELYGILRFISAWNTTGGRKQEYIMMSNVLQTIGKRVSNSSSWEGLNFLLLPTYEELIGQECPEFENICKLRSAIIEYGENHFTEEYSLHDQTFYLLDNNKNVPVGEGQWDRLLEGLSSDTQKLLTQLKEDFNRNYQRPFVFIVYFYNLFKGFDFSKMTLDDYVSIYNQPPRGIYPKVLGCFLQQAFKKYECIPVDTWVTAFFEELFQTPAPEIPTSGKDLGKFERFIWNSAQLRKTNQPFFNDIIFCVKTGILHSKTQHNRKPNPLSCYLCSIRADCPTYEDISNDKIFVINEDQLSDNPSSGDSIQLTRPAMDIDVNDKEYFDGSLLPAGVLSEFKFIITSKDGKAREVYVSKKLDNTKWILTDSMSSFTAKKSVEDGVYQVKDLIVDE